eukprot:TRINITY_DN1474_c0_g1_i1.p1 TRINITY_DN1474_c0_g1~~TRINITY_DN1474_c0_g1_i1.p1  ORF type:complete len:220 (+),score=47.35 TRINITY_DN1474_c0_g1_i1:267-926(+)
MSGEEAEYRCFIGGLSWNTSDRSLGAAFEKFGRLVEAKVVLDRYTGRSKGYGFVTFDDKRAMEEAIEAMHGMSLDGRNITVDIAQSKSSGGGDYGGRSFGGGRSSGGYGSRGGSYGGRGGRGGYGGGSECFKCGRRGHFARECPDGDSGRAGDRYGGRSDRYDGGRSGYGPDRSSDRYGSGRSRNGGYRAGGDGDRHNRGGPYDRPTGGSSRVSHDDRY